MMESDFLLQNALKICHVEVKSTSFRAHASLDRFSDKFAKRLGPKYIVCRGNYEVGTEGVTYIPFYMAHCL